MNGELATMQALHTLLQHEQTRRDQAALRVHRAEQSAERARAQADQLLSYRAEYETRWAAQFQHRATMEIVHCYRGFMQRLDQAVVQQARQTQGVEAHLDQARRALIEAERQVASVRKLIERRTAEQLRLAGRREQRQADDLALRLRRHPAPHAGALHEPANS